MRAIVFNGAEYRSLSKACKELKISYQKLRRLCRHYVRASKNPAVALAWLTGEEKLSVNEPKTYKYSQDLERGLERQTAFKSRQHSKMIEVFK